MRPPLSRVGSREGQRCATMRARFVWVVPVRIAGGFPSPKEPGQRCSSPSGNDGYPAIFIMMLAESASIPAPSELTMLFAGSLSACTVAGAAMPRGRRLHQPHRRSLRRPPRPRRAPAPGRRPGRVWTVPAPPRAGSGTRWRWPLPAGPGTCRAARSRPADHRQVRAPGWPGADDGAASAGSCRSTPGNSPPAEADRSRSATPCRSTPGTPPRPGPVRPLRPRGAGRLPRAARLPAARLRAV
jgi:hypothetical protein